MTVDCGTIDETSGDNQGGSAPDSLEPPTLGADSLGAPTLDTDILELPSLNYEASASDIPECTENKEPSVIVSQGATATDHLKPSSQGASATEDFEPPSQDADSQGPPAAHNQVGCDIDWTGEEYQKVEFAVLYWHKTTGYYYDPVSIDTAAVW